ncbi:MAG: DEAD/DEAH box helicase [Gammaproteobacteria bacterium]|nr:DEAD/DEAH box helicase [Gammaproteobacteria bacterium]
MPNELLTVPRRPRSALHPYQVRAVQFLIDHAESGLFLDPGLGKTIVMLTVIAFLLAAGAVRRVLVVGPPRVVATVWAQEAAAWEHTAHLRVLVLAGSPARRQALLQDGLATADVVCVSYGLLPWLHRRVKREVWDWVVIDESSLIKDHRTRRWKAVAFTAMTAKRRTLLTGTPTPKSWADLWAQVTVADLGKRFGRSPGGFLARYFVQTASGWVAKEDTRRALTAKLKDFAIALRARDYLNLPALVETEVVVEMPASARAVYAELTASFEAELEDGLVVDVANAAVMAGKLQQVCQGAVIVDEQGGWSELHRAKLEAVAELVSELNGEPCLIAYWFKHDLARLRTLFPDAPVLGSGLSVAKLNALIDRWNRGDIPVLLLHPASAGHGLNLQAGGRHLIWMALPWSWELWSQTIARLYRQGQTKPVMVYRVVARDSIDERICRVLADRQGGHEALLAALKAEVRDVVSRAERLRAARVAMQQAHPDRGGSVEAFIAARRQFDALRLAP